MQPTFATLSNGVQIPMIGYGTYKLDPREAQKNVELAIATGYRSVDTATFYNNEREIGLALKQTAVKRDEIFITTKLWNSDHGYENALRAFDKSLGLLGLDYVDLYLIHWPGKDRYCETWRALEKICSEKRARAIGVSNFFKHHLETLEKSAQVFPMVNQIELHPYLFDAQAVTYCKDKGMLLEAWSPLQRAGKVFKDPVVLGLAAKHEKTPAQVILRWEIQNGVRVLPKSTNIEHMRSNLDIFSFELESPDMAAMNTLSRDARVGPHPDKLLF